MQDPDFPWPDVAEVVEFRARVFEKVEAVIRAMPHPRDEPVTMSSPYWALFMGFEHERIHLETSSVLMRQLPIDLVAAPRGWRTAPSYAPAPADAPANALVAVATSETVVLGKPKDFPSFGWDNEYGARTVSVPAFSAGTFKVSNAEFLPFVERGGYADKQWWVTEAGDDEGWRWASYRNATHPSFWVASAHPDMQRFHGGAPGKPYQKDDGHERAGDARAWKLRTIFDIIDMPWDWPVEVNAHEAAAFMRWKAANENRALVAAGKAPVSYRFPTEAEYHVIRGDPSAFAAATVGAGRARAGDTAGEGRAGSEANGKTAAAAWEEADEAGRVDVVMQPAAPGNTNWRFHSSTPVDFYGASSTGFHDSHGNVWEWVEDHFAPLPGFEIHHMYDDFSAPCFDGWHTSIMGSSWASTGDLSSSFARYHFRRHFFQHLGFRYVRVEAPEPFPGAATALNLWEGVGAGSVSHDIANAFCPAAERMPFVAALVAPSNALSYPLSLAQLSAKAYETHVRPPGAPVAAAVALHLGCAVGGATFELCRYFRAVVGVDQREDLVRHARILKHHGQFEFDRVREGILTDTALARVPAGVDRARAHFLVADASDLPSAVLDEAAALRADSAAGAAGAAGAFDLVVIDDVLTELRQPLDLVRRLRAYVRAGGVVVIASSNDWRPEVTPRNSWLGGLKMNGEEMSTLHILKFHLKREFDFLETVDLARMSRENHRCFRMDVLEASIWRRKA